MRFEIDKRWTKRLRGKIEGYEFDVGVQTSGPHKRALSKKHGLKTVAGGPARKQGRKSSGQTLQSVSDFSRQQVNVFRAPFKHRTPDINKIFHEFFRVAFKNAPVKKLEAVLLGAVRNPILKQAYGRNKIGTAIKKGFNRLLIDTGQFFKAIAARVRKRV